MNTDLLKPGFTISAPNRPLNHFHSTVTALHFLSMWGEVGGGKKRKKSSITFCHKHRVTETAFRISSQDHQVARTFFITQLLAIGYHLTPLFNGLWLYFQHTAYYKNC
jgi:hypothetical protein